MTGLAYDTAIKRLRSSAADLLNRQLALAINLHAQVKQAHWNVRGPAFIGLHDLFDGVADGDEAWSDLVAERAGALGAAADLRDDEVSRSWVKGIGRKKLVIAGLATEVCVALSALSAAQAGYEVYAVIDASSDFSPLVQQISTMRLISAGVVVTFWVAVVAELAGNTQVHGRHMAALSKAHVPDYAAEFKRWAAIHPGAPAMRAQLGV